MNLANNNVRQYYLIKKIKRKKIVQPLFHPVFNNFEQLVIPDRLEHFHLLNMSVVYY